MCRWLNLPHSSYYYKALELISEVEFEEKVKQIFLKSQLRYCARKIKQCLATDGIILSRRRIRRIMKSLNLVSLY